MHFDYNLFISLILVRNIVKTHSMSSSNFKRIVSTKSTTNFYSIATKTIEIMTTCYSNDLDNTVIAGEWLDFSNWKNLLSQKSISIIGSNDSELFKRHKRLTGHYAISERVVKSLRYPAKIAIVSTKHQPLKDTLKMLRSSKFWSSKASFFLIDDNPNNVCSNVSQSFQLAWNKYNILRAIYICYTANGTVYFYNFNPFLDYAPKPWEKIDAVLENKRNHSTTIYRVSANDMLASGKSYCELLDFDKTKTLDDYPVKLCGVLNPILFSSKSNAPINSVRSINDYSGIDSIVAQIIWSKLRTTPTVTSFLDSGYIENNIPYGIVKRITNEDYDMVINEFYYRSFWRLETYPHGISGMCALTRKRYSSHMATMLWMFKPKVISIVLAISLLVAILLKYILKIGFGNACLHVLGMLAGVSMDQPISPINRINMAYLIFLMFGLNIYLESSLTSVIVAPNDVHNIDTMDDIVKHKYEVSGRPFVKEFLVEDNFTQVYSENYFDECMDKIKRGYKVACIRDCFSAIFYEKKYDFVYLSKQSLKDIHMTFLFREDWPLRMRFNSIVQRIREAGIIAYVKNIEVFKMNPHRVKNEPSAGAVKFEEETPFHPKELAFAWYILGAGMTLSFSIFLFEVFNRNLESRKSVFESLESKSLKLPSLSRSTNASAQ